jgi:hypothetical protein
MIHTYKTYLEEKIHKIIDFAWINDQPVHIYLDQPVSHLSKMIIIETTC